jgi:CheY-like chemotaxis protein
MTETARVLCVDDETMVLDGIERNLGEFFEIVTASSGADALDLIARQPPFAAIVSDMRMPHMNGAEFLARARQLAPDTSRLLLTGYSETSTAIAAVNDGHIFRFLCKPCPPDTLHRHLDDAIRQHQLITGERELLESTLNGAVQLMSDLLALVAPTVFDRARQLQARVAHVARRLGYPDAWEYELAALLAHIGCVAMPTTILERVWTGGRTTVDERASYDNHPAVAHDLIAAIPRLERVAKIVLNQHATKATGDAVVDRGAALLRTALKLDQLLVRGIRLDDALGVLRESGHDLPIIDALGAHARSGAGRTRTVKVADAVVGWVLERDVMSPSGALLVRAGTTLSPILIQSLRRFSLNSGVVEPIHVRPI